MSRPKLTKCDRFLDVLADGRWHSTRDLARRVGHTFAIAKFKLVQRGHVIERRRHPRRRFQFEYRMLNRSPQCPTPVAQGVARRRNSPRSTRKRTTTVN